jgi:hypothetical protein
LAWDEGIVLLPITGAGIELIDLLKVKRYFIIGSGAFTTLGVVTTFERVARIFQFIEFGQLVLRDFEGLGPHVQVRFGLCF